MLLPLVAANPSIAFPSLFRLAGIAPFSGVLGFLTPLLVDRWSGGDPAKAGKAYAVNVVGCILGPLVSGFLLLPLMSERWVLFVFSLPWLLIGIRPEWLRKDARLRLDWRAGASCAVVLLALALVFTQTGYEDQFTHREVLRDNTATVIATGEGFDKRLLVNGVGMTGLNSITKFMAHLPLAFLGSSSTRHPRRVLRHGDNIPLAALLGHPGDGGGVGAQRPESVRLLPSRWPATAAFAAVAPGD